MITTWIHRWVDRLDLWWARAKGITGWTPRLDKLKNDEAMQELMQWARNTVQDKDGKLIVSSTPVRLTADHISYVGYVGDRKPGSD